MVAIEWMCFGSSQISATMLSCYNIYRHHELMPNSSDSRSRQSPPHAPILCALLRLVSLPHQQSAIIYRSLRCHKEAVRSHAQDPADRQGRGAPQGGCAGRRRKGRGRGAEILRSGTAVGICGIHGAGSYHCGEYGCPSSLSKREGGRRKENE